jgi:hypothetical protein
VIPDVLQQGDSARVPDLREDLDRSPAYFPVGVLKRRREFVGPRGSTAASGWVPEV